MVPGQPGVIAYSKLRSDVRAARKEYEDLVKKLEPEVPKLKEAVQAAEANNSGERARVEALREAYARNIGTVPANLNEYDQAVGVRKQLEGVAAKDSGDKLAPILAMNAKLEELQKEPANLAYMQETLIRRTLDQARANAERLGHPETNRKEAALKTPVADEKLDGIRKELEQTSVAYAQAQLAVERQKESMLRRFGDESRQLVLLEAQDPEYLRAAKQLQQRMDTATLSYMDAVGAEKRFAERRETVVNQAYERQTYKENDLGIRVVGTETNAQVMRRVLPFNDRNALLTPKDAQLVDASRMVAMEFKATPEQAALLKEELTQLGLTPQMKVPSGNGEQTVALSIPQKALEEYIRRNPEKSDGKMGGLTVQLRSGKSVTFDDTALMRPVEPQPIERPGFLRRPEPAVAVEALREKELVFLAPGQPPLRESGISVVPPRPMGSAAERLLAPSPEQALFDQLASDGKIRYVTDENLAPVQPPPEREAGLPLRLELPGEKPPQKFQPVYMVSGTPEEVQQLRERLTALNIPFRDAPPQTAKDVERYGARDTLVIDEAQISRYLPQTGMTRLEALTSPSPAAAKATAERQAKRQLDSNRDGKVDIKDFDRNGDGKLTLRDFSDANGMMKPENVQDMQSKVDQLAKLASNPELKAIRDMMMALARENNIPLSGDSPLGLSLPSGPKGGARGK